jgi:hypothetical protein
LSAPITSRSGCGNIPCTGRQNYLIYDHDGKLLIGDSKPAVVLPNNSFIGNSIP